MREALRPVAGVMLGNALAEFAEHLCTPAGFPVKRLTGSVAAASANVTAVWASAGWANSVYEPCGVDEGGRASLPEVEGGARV